MANNRKIIETPKSAVIQVKTKNGTVKSEIVWNESFGLKFTNKFSTAQKNFDMEVLKLCDKYVPMDTGVLKNSAQIASNIGSGELVWNAPYAHKVYYYTGKTNGLRGRNWGDRCKADNKQYFETFARRLMK